MTTPRPEIATTKGEESPQLSLWEKIVRHSLVSYLESCLTGDKKTFFTNFAPYSKQWILRDDATWTGENSLERAIQISRFYENVAENPPQIFVRTTGNTPLNQNLGSFSSGINEGNGLQTVSFIDSAKVPIEIACCAKEPDKASLLCHFIETAFGSLCRLLINFQLTGVDASHGNWCVMLPLQWSTGQTTDVPIGEDRKNRLWTVTKTAEVLVEVAIAAQYTVGRNTAMLMSNELSTSLPTTVKVGSYTPLYIYNLRPSEAIWKSSDYKLAIITSDETLYAKRAGTVIISLVSARTQQVYATQTIVIT